MGKLVEGNNASAANVVAAEDRTLDRNWEATAER